MNINRCLYNAHNIVIALNHIISLHRGKQKRKKEKARKHIRKNLVLSGHVRQSMIITAYFSSYIFVNLHERKLFTPHSGFFKYTPIDFFTSPPPHSPYFVPDHMATKDYPLMLVSETLKTTK